MNDKEFIINGKLYSTKDSLLLYRQEGFFPCGVSVYYTEKGAFFVVRSQIMEETEVKVINRQEALEILNENPAGIINENYIKVFGKVEKG